jgi:hypothetical protein
LLVEISVSYNFLTNFFYLKLNPLTLQDLRIHNNRFPATDIQVFTLLSNLENLSIGNHSSFKKKYQNASQLLNNNYYENNKFYGSFQSLQNCTNLKKLFLYNIILNLISNIYQAACKRLLLMDKWEMN